jgi:hypothetical protein
MMVTRKGDYHHAYVIHAARVAGGILRLALAWLLKQRWGVSIGVPQALAGA